MNIVKYKKCFVVLSVLFSLFLYDSNALTLSEKSSKLYELNISGEKTSKFFVELAYTKEKIRNGLMYRKHLAENSGMLFFFGKESLIKMWMKNTYIPLDMIFIDKEGEILRIVTNTTPESLKAISSAFPIKYVLELNAGATKKNNIQKGDKVNVREIITSLLRIEGLKEQTE